MLSSVHQASRSIEIGVDAGTLMEVLCDFEQYPRFLSSVMAVELKEQEADRWRVWFEVVLFRRNLQYTLDLTRNDNRKLSWVLVAGDWMTRNTGSWTLTPLEPSLTRAAYSIQVTIEGNLPPMVTSLLVDASIPRLLREFKRWAEHSAQGNPPPRRSPGEVPA
ncbi:MAG: SRPBCC family protein [Bradymonadales bacterium]|nr:SRPBCC family protein [Bradymonadales bacterium]